MWIVNIIALALVFAGSLNWGLVGVFNYNFVSAIFGSNQNIGSIIVYILVLLASLWLIAYAIFSMGRIRVASKSMLSTK